MTHTEQIFINIFFNSKSNLIDGVLRKLLSPGMTPRGLLSIHGKEFSHIYNLGRKFANTRKIYPILVFRVHQDNGIKVKIISNKQASEAKGSLAYDDNIGTWYNFQDFLKRFNIKEHSIERVLFEHF